MSDIEYLELGIIEFEKDLKDDPNNKWLKRCIKGMKSCKQRLESIENAKPNEALGKVGVLASELGTSKDMKFAETRFPRMLTTIQQALIKAQLQEKFIDIIKRKGMLISAKELNLMETYEVYKNVINERKLQRELMMHIIPTLIDWDNLESTPFYTEKEFNIIKETLK